MTGATSMSPVYRACRSRARPQRRTGQRRSRSARTPRSGEIGDRDGVVVGETARPRSTSCQAPGGRTTRASGSGRRATTTATSSSPRVNATVARRPRWAVRPRRTAAGRRRAAASAWCRTWSLTVSAVGGVAVAEPAEPTQARLPSRSGGGCRGRRATRNQPRRPGRCRARRGRWPAAASGRAKPARPSRRPARRRREVGRRTAGRASTLAGEGLSTRPSRRVSGSIHVVVDLGLPDGLLQVGVEPVGVIGHAPIRVWKRNHRSPGAGPPSTTRAR